VTAEIYDPAKGTWSAAPELNEGKQSHSATLLNNGSVSVASGDDVDDNYLTSSELLDMTLRPFIVRGHGGRSHP